MANNEMFIKDPLDPDFGRISYDYLPTGVAPPATPNLNQVLNAGNQALGENIDAQGGDVLCDVLKCVSIQPVAFPIIDTIAVNGNLGMAPTSKVAFASDAIITANYSGSPEKSVIRTINAGSNTTYQIAEANINYDTSTKLLTINPPSIPPMPLLSSQGLNVKGQITAQYGGVNADNVIQTNSIFASRDGSQPRVEFQDSAGYAHGQVGWNTTTGRTILAGDNGFKINMYGDKYKIEGSDAIGYLGIETSGVDTEIRHYNTGASVMETRVRVEGAGTTSITSAGAIAKLQMNAVGGVNGSIRADDNDGGVVVETASDLILQSGGSTYLKTTNASGSILLQADGAIEASLANNQMMVASVASPQAIIRLQAQSAVAGTLTLDETASQVKLEAEGGYGVFLGSAGGGITAQADTDININSASGSAFITTASNTNIQTQSGNAGYTFDSQLRYDNSDTQLVNTNKVEQVPTNTIAVPAFQPRSTIPPSVIDTTNPPLGMFYATPPFIWRYSGTGGGQSAYCYTERVEVDVDITILGSLGDSIQWGVVMVDTLTSTRYYSVGAYRSFDSGDPANGLEYTTNGWKTNPSGDFNHTANIRCYFDGVNAIIDGTPVGFEIFAVCHSSFLTVNDGNISYRIRPATRVP